MTLHSALEDLRSTTLSAISGIFRKLEYIAGLRNSKGDYGHWGLARVHGAAAEKALEQEHRQIMTIVLTTPISVLLEDVQKSSEDEQLTPAQYLAKLEGQKALLPSNPAPGSERHLNSVLHALSALVTHQSDANRPIS